MVIPSLNRDGDCLSDLVMQLFGSIAGAESVLLAFDSSLKPSCVMAEAPHGTAPRLFGKNVANPMAMILACAALVAHVPDARSANASRAIYESVLETTPPIAQATPDHCTALKCSCNVKRASSTVLTG
jgi:isocitrate dehydrogenase